MERSIQCNIPRLAQKVRLLALLVTLTAIVSCKSDYVEIRFDSSSEVSGRKFALEDIAPGLPGDWDGYEYVVLEFMITTPQRFHVGFTTETGYNELRVMSYTANGWSRLAIPLRFYREPPGAWHDLAGTYNQPRNTGWINLGGQRGPLRGVDSIGIRMRAPIGDQVLRLRSVSLHVEDPGDIYLGDVPVMDKFGQWNLGDWEGKIYSEEQLRSEWEAEDSAGIPSGEYGYSRYGGYSHVRIDEGTGFFRTGQINGRWWFVDPDGYKFLSVAVNCIGPGQGGNAVRINERRNMYGVLPPEGRGFNPERPGVANFGTWNLYRRYGDDYMEQSIENIFTRMDRWGINTIGNWSSMEVINRNRKAFMLQLRGLGIEGELMGLADVYASDFRSGIDEAVSRFTRPYRNNPWLIGYFTANEPAWLGQEERLCDIILGLDEERAIRRELVRYLDNGDTPERREQFIYETFRIFLETVDEAVKRHSPGHLNLGMRFGGVPNREILEICANVFDVFSFNCYDLYPPQETMDRILEVSGLPMIIGEYHFGTVDRGMAQSLWQVDSQEERGTAYRYYTEKAYAHPGLIGTAYFQWADQDLTGRGYDGENYNCGLVDVTDRPYPYQVEAMSVTAKRLFDVHSGNIEPFDRPPARARGYGGIPDLWDQAVSGSGAIFPEPCRFN